MIKLIDRDWKEIEIQELFNVIRGNAKDITKRNMGGGIALISATDKNNAFYDFITTNNNERVYENTLTIHNNGNGVGLAFYHNYKFIATSDVTILIDKTKLMNAYVARFLIAILQKQKEKYCYGYKLSNERLKKQKIMLPFDENNKIDFSFMERYIKEKEKYMLEKYTKYLENLDTLHTHTHTHGYSLDNVEWRLYKISELFNVKIGKAIDGNKVDKLNGKTAYITRKESNNGLDGFIDYDNKYLNENYAVITIGNETCKPFVQITPFYTGTKVNILEPKFNATKSNLLYICNCLEKHKSKYSYSYTINSTRLKEQTIILPTTKDKPDYEYMEQCISAMIKKQLTKYLSFKNNYATK